LDARNENPGLAVVARSTLRQAASKYHETEVKFTTDPSGLKIAIDSQLLSSGSALQTHNLRTIYFDTPEGSLRKKGIVLRIRKKGRAALVLGVKSTGTTPTSLFRRNEIEVRSRDHEPNLALFDRDTATMLMSIIGDRPLEAQFETQVKRRTTILNYGQSEVEASFDEGCIVNRQSRVPLTEVELELKSGNEVDLNAMAMQFAEALPLHLDFVSKSEKGFRTCGNESAVPIKAKPIRLKSGATVENAIIAIIANSLAQFAANWAPLRETEDPESIHQLRVALRRLRSALSMFKEILPDEFEDAQHEAKRIASALSPAREWDVLRASIEQVPLLYKNCPKSCDALLAALQDCRNAAYKEARSLINGRDATVFVLKVQGLLARRAWDEAPSRNEQRQLTMAAKKFARRSLSKLSKRVLKRGKGFPDLSDGTLHELRISFKHLRYSAEFFGSLFDRPRNVKSYIERVAEIQELLGTQNDVIMARQFLDRLSSMAGTGSEKASGFILGWQVREASIADESLYSSWKKFKRTDAFWD
jgi:triphosphatase